MYTFLISRIQTDARVVSLKGVFICETREQLLKVRTRNMKGKEYNALSFL